jgi:hypothetical protein
MIKIFNLDLHISVIKDIQYILKDLYEDNVEVINWSISGHSWVFKENSVTPDIINSNTWKNINIEMINQFVHKYKDFLSTFDGFIVTHTPVFCLLYETFNKPITRHIDPPAGFTDISLNDNTVYFGNPIWLTATSTYVNFGLLCIWAKD